MTQERLIIGAGMAGLATGIFAQQHGFRSWILEMHTVPGLHSIYMPEQWGFVPSLPLVTLNGRNLVQRLVRKANVRAADQIG